MNTLKDLTRQIANGESPESDFLFGCIKAVLLLAVAYCGFKMAQALGWTA